MLPYFLSYLPTVLRFCLPCLLSPSLPLFYLPHTSSSLSAELILHKVFFSLSVLVSLPFFLYIFLLVLLSPTLLHLSLPFFSRIESGRKQNPHILFLSPSFLPFVTTYPFCISLILSFSSPLVREMIENKKERCRAKLRKEGREEGRKEGGKEGKKEGREGKVR